jgi:hypothetical protein
MHSILSIIYIALTLAAVVLSTPTPNTQKRSFSHVVKRRVNTGPGAGVNALAAAFRKYNFDMPASMSTTAGSNKAVTGQTGNVNAQPEQNAAEYLSPVTIGGQTLNLDFDTGSSDLYV